MMPSLRRTVFLALCVALFAPNHQVIAAETTDPASPRPFGIFVKTVPHQPVDPNSDDDLPGSSIVLPMGEVRSLPSRGSVELVSGSSTTQLSDQLNALGIDLHRPTGLAWDGTSIWIIDTGHRRIVRAVMSNDQARVLRAEEINHDQMRRPIGATWNNETSELFVSDAWSDRIFVFDSEGRMTRTISEHGSQRGFLSGPMGLACSDGILYVADSRNSRVQAFRIADGSFHSEFGLHVIRPHEAEGRLHYPSHVRFGDGNSELIIDEPWERRSQIFRRAADSESVPERLPLGADDFVHYGPGIDAYDRLLAITDPDTHTVRVFDLSLETPVLIGVVGGYGSAPHQFIHPASVAFLPPTNDLPLRLVVADRGNARLALFSLDWSPEETLRFRPRLASLVRTVDLSVLHARYKDQSLDAPIDPVSVVATDLGSIAVLDEANSAVVDFDTRLRMRSIAPLPPVIPDTPSLWQRLRAHAELGLFAVDSASARVVRLRLDPNGDAHDLTTIELSDWCEDPSDIVWNDGTILVVDRRAHRLVQFDPDFRPIAYIGQEGLDGGEFFSPTSVLQLEGEQIAVVDRGNHRLQIFTDDWKLKTIAGPRLYLLDAVIGAEPIRSDIPRPDSD